jgi:hypothetical protein
MHAELIAIELMDRAFEAVKSVIAAIADAASSATASKLTAPYSAVRTVLAAAACMQWPIERDTKTARSLR